MAKFSKWIDAAAGDPLDKVAADSLRSRLEPVEHFVRLAAADPNGDIENVHQMRVWSRRAAAATRLYKDMLPKRRRKWLNQTLKDIRGAAGDARDDDVFAMRLASEPDKAKAARVLDKVRDHRSAAQRPIVRLSRKLMASGLFERKVRKLLAKVRFRGDAAAAPADFHAWAVGQLRDQHNGFFAASKADFSDYENLHCFRIAGKELRYAVELLAPAFDESLRIQTYPLIQDLQDRLGEINDHATASARLAAWSGEVDDAELREYLRSLQQYEETQMAAKRQDFLDWWSGELADRLLDELGRLIV